jgi:hypothetical protein
MSALTYLFCAAPAEPVAEPPSQYTTFSLGISPHTTFSRRQRLAAKAQQKRRRPKKKQTTTEQRRFIPRLRASTVAAWRAPKQYQFVFARNPWILCDHNISLSVDTFFREMGKSFTQIYINIVMRKRRQQQFYQRWKSYSPSQLSIEELNTYMKIAISNQRLRTAFGVLARRWIQKKLRCKNEEDLVTGEKALEPVTIVDWASRSVYEFEAKTICRDMVSRLLVNTWMFFPSPKCPRNPYTNQALTEGQFYSVMKQLRRWGYTHWTLEALYSAKYNLNEFDRDMYMKLKRTHHNALFANPSSENAKEVLLEFIEDEHSAHGVDYEKDIYVWAAEHQTHHHIMHQWRIRCEKHYRIAHFPGDKAQNELEKENILLATKRLSAYPILLVEKYDAAHEKKYVSVADKRAAVAHAEILQIDYQIRYVDINDVNLAAVFAVYAADAADAAEEGKEAEASEDSDDSSSEAD